MPTSSFDKEFILRTEEEVEHFLEMIEKAMENPLDLKLYKKKHRNELSPERIKKILEAKNK